MLGVRQREEINLGVQAGQLVAAAVPVVHNNLQMAGYRVADSFVAMAPLVAFQAAVEAAFEYRANKRQRVSQKEETLEEDEEFHIRLDIVNGKYLGIMY